MLHARTLSVLFALSGLCALLPACSLESENEPEPVANAGALAPSPTDDEDLSIGQHTALTIDRNAPTTYRVVAYGDSIFAGYRGSLFEVARRSAPYVAGEYFAAAWGSNVEVIRRTRSGALAKEVYERTVVADKRYMADPSTRAVYFEMCGNDYLDVRKRFADASGNCNRGRLDAALATCTTYMAKAMEAINATAVTARQKAIANLYYPGFDADNVTARCTEPDGRRVNVQDELLPMMARSNWRACTLARQYGFACIDSFAELMGADYDSNGDGKIDVDGLRFDPEESEADYVARISVTLRSTVRDANVHPTSAETSVDYLQDDDTHPTYFLGTVSSGTVKRFAPDFSDADLASGKSPQWDRSGHERMGWALWQAGPSSLEPAPKPPAPEPPAP